MAMGNSGGCSGLNVEINVTPLIDVLLVLLITFMVIVPVTPHGLDTWLPQHANTPGQNQDAAIVVQIVQSRDGQVSYKINQENVSLSDLGNRLVGVFSVRADKALFIKGDGQLDFLAVAQVVDIGKDAGADHIALITPKDEEGVANRHPVS